MIARDDGLREALAMIFDGLPASLGKMLRSIEGKHGFPSSRLRAHAATSERVDTVDGDL